MSFELAHKCAISLRAEPRPPGVHNRRDRGLGRWRLFNACGLPLSWPHYLFTESAMASTILAGPVLRRCRPDRLVFWLASREPLSFRLLLPEREPVLLDAGQQHQLQVGERCFIQLLDVALEQPLPEDTLLPY